MDVAQLRHFVLVAQLGSMNRAARLLQLTQPAVSRQIAALERSVGVQLLSRTGHGVVLSSAGSIFLEKISEALRIIDDATEQVRAVDEPTGHITVGVPQTVGAAVAVEAVREFRRLHPKVTIRLVSLQSGALCEWLLNGRVDVAVIYDPSGERGLVLSDLLEEDLFLVGAPDSDFGDDRIFRFEDLARLPLIMPGAPNGLRVLLDEFARKHGGALKIDLEVEGLDMQKDLIGYGAGYGILPFLAISDELRADTLRAWRIRPAMTRRLSCATAPRRRRSATANVLIKCLEREAARVLGESSWLLTMSAEVPA